MVLGHIQGKVTTNEFSFVAKEEPKNFEYVQVFHKVYDYVLCQVVEVTKSERLTTALCQVIGYRDKEKIRRPRIPFDPGTEVLRAEDEFISSVIALGAQGSAVIGHLEGRSIPVSVDLNTMLTKHVAVLAKSGAGKSYTVGVLLEEILERGVPLVIIDPHGEYGSLAHCATDVEGLAVFGLTPKAYPVAQYANTEVVVDARPFRLSTHLSGEELMHLFPGKLSATMQAVLYSALKNLRDVNFDSLLVELESEESPAKFSIISTIEYLRSLPIFSASPTPYSELVRPGQATVINLKGYGPDVAEIIVYKLCKDLFALRKSGRISPFFLVIEEAHTFCPERSFGETKASRVLRDIASEGRKFGLGLCVVSQRPARVDKSVLSQCSTQIILKVTNPHDLKAISSSVEGITAESEREIKNLPIGSALVTGLTEVPLFVAIRPRRTLHGGHAVDVLGLHKPAESFIDRVASQDELLPLIKPVVSPSDLVLMSTVPLVGIRTTLVPAYQFVCREGEDHYKLLVEMESGSIIVDKDSFVCRKLPALKKLSARELSILQALYAKGPLSADALTAKLGLIGEELALLEQKGYVVAGHKGFRSSEEYIYTRLSKVASTDTISFESLAYDEKRIPVLNVDDVRQDLNTFTTIEDQFECFVVKYTPIVRKDV